MFFKSIYILILICINQINSIDSQKDVTCDRKTEVQMDYALAKLMVFGQKSARFPENAQHLRPYCNDALRLFDSVLHYTKHCLNKFGRDSAAVLLHGIGAELKSVCRTGRLNKRAKDLLAAAPCANAANAEFGKCYVVWIDRYMGALNLDKKLRIPIGCCGFHDFLRCMELEAEDVPKCTTKTVNFLVKWFNKVMEGILQLMCTVYDDSNSQCDVIISDIPARNTTQKRYKSILMPLINIAMSLGDDGLPGQKTNN